MRVRAALVSACVALLAAGCTPGQPAPPPAAGPSLASDAAGNGTLVLYDVDNGYGELYAMEVANLVSRFGTWRAVPVSRYAKGDNAHYAAVVYIGSATDETLPGAFLDDVLTARTPTLWLNRHIDQLTARRPGVAAGLGFTTRGYDKRPVTEVRYKGVALTRDKPNSGGVMRLTVTNRARVNTVALAVHRGGDTPLVVAALKYMASHGGTLIVHGYTHGYDGGPNPYGVSGEDFEFFRAHVGKDNGVVLDGPVPGDSAAWAAGRLAAAKAEWAAVGLPAPEIFEFPHYAASATDYRALSGLVAARYERAMYFSGVLTGGRIDPTRYASQFFPYPVRDVYGAAVIPETLGNVERSSFNGHATRSPDQILDSARRQLVVRDGVASFFYHPFLGLSALPQLVAGIQALGYTFAAPRDMIP